MLSGGPGGNVRRSSGPTNKSRNKSLIQFPIKRNKDPPDCVKLV